MSIRSILKMNLVPEGRGARIAFLIVVVCFLSALASFGGYQSGSFFIPAYGWTPVEGAVKTGTWTFGVCMFIGLLWLLSQASRARSLTALRKALANKDSLTRVSAAYELGCMGGDAVAVLGDLQAMSADSDDTVRIWSRWAIKQISRTNR